MTDQEVQAQAALAAQTDTDLEVNAEEVQSTVAEATEAVDQNDPLAVKESLFEELADDDASLDLESIIEGVSSEMAEDEEYTLSSVIPAHTAVARLKTLKPSVVVMKATNKQVVRFWQLSWTLEYNTETGAHTSRTFNERIYMLRKDGTPLAMGKEQISQALAGIVVAFEYEGAPELTSKELKAAKKEALVKIKSNTPDYTIRAIMANTMDTPMIMDITVTPAKDGYDEGNGVKLYAIRPVDYALVQVMSETAEA